MSLRNWKRVKKGFYNKKLDVYLFILKSNHGYVVAFGRMVLAEPMAYAQNVIGAFKTKVQAKKFAKEYMLRRN